MPVEFALRTSEFRARVASTVFEKLLPSIKLEKREGATLELASNMDSLQGNYLEAAHLYSTVLETSETREKRLEAFFGLSQQLINLGRLGQAKELLNSDTFLELLPSGDIDEIEREEVYVLGRRQEKLGWIADNEGDYKTAAQCFWCARHLILGNVSSPRDLNGREKDLIATATHFLGRANFGLRNYEEAIENFREHLVGEGLKKDEQGFGHGWLARCYMAQDKMGKADVEVRLVRYLFKEHLQTHPEKGLMAYYHLLAGELEARVGEFDYSRANFENALGIFYAKERYPKGESAALFGIAGTYWAQRNIGAAFIYALKGFKTYPLSILKPSL